MELIARPLVAADFPACLALLQGGRAYPDALIGQLSRFWRRLLRDEALKSTVVEARDTSGRSFIAAFGASVFVTDGWMAAARSSEVPYLTERTIRLELDGRPCILRPAEIARENAADGLNLLVLHYGEATELPDEVRPPLRYRMFEAFVQEHRGYRIRAIVQEFWDELDHEFVVNGWGRVVTDYRNFFERGGASPSLGQRAHLIGITREEALANPGNLASPMFAYTPPRLGFTRAEQAMLRLALLGSTDVELARSLGVALPTVKSRWRTIYGRIGSAASEMFSDSAWASDDTSARGPEKRRQLLEYVRRHLEELRPPLPRSSSRRGRSSARASR